MQFIYPLAYILEISSNFRARTAEASIRSARERERMPIVNQSAQRWQTNSLSLSLSAGLTGVGAAL